MQALQQTYGTEDFRTRLAARGRGVLLLDFDGTLAPFHAEPERVRPYPGILPALGRIQAAGRTRLVIVTGRSLADGLPMLGLDQRPEMWGSHGRERLLPDGSRAIRPIEPGALAALVLADSWCEAIEAVGGRCERKPGCLAIHWRGGPPGTDGRVRAVLASLWERHGVSANLRWTDFDGGVEFRAADIDKGDVVDAVLATEPADVPVAYLGDDTTDEDAFERLRGRGMTVLVRTECRATSADFWARPPGEVLAFLDLWNRAFPGEGAGP